MPISRNCRARSGPHGTEYLLARACKDHDCADNNTVLLYSAAQGVVYGKANRQRRSTLIGAAARGGQRIGSFVAGRMAAESITNGAISDAKSSQAYLKFSDDDRRRHVLSHFVCIGSCSKATDFITSRAAKFQDRSVLEV